MTVVLQRRWDGEKNQGRRGLIVERNRDGRGETGRARREKCNPCWMTLAFAKSKFRSRRISVCERLHLHFRSLINSSWSFFEPTRSKEERLATFEQSRPLKQTTLITDLHSAGRSFGIFGLASRA